MLSVRVHLNDEKSLGEMEIINTTEINSLGEHMYQVNLDGERRSLISHNREENVWFLVLKALDSLNKNGWIPPMWTEAKPLGEEPEQEEKEDEPVGE